MAPKATGPSIIDEMTVSNDSLKDGPEEVEKPYRVTMELPIFLTIVSSYLTGSVMGNVLLHRTCTQVFEYTAEECAPFLSPNNSTVDRDIEIAVQRYNTAIAISKALIESIGPTVLSLFLGVWSDSHGRKPLVVYPLLGMTTASLVTLTYAMIPSLGPWWYLLTAVPVTLTGGNIAIFTGAYTYISDISTVKSRSIRMTYVDATLAASTVLGALMSAFLLTAIGNIPVLITCAIFNLSGFAFATTLKESLSNSVKGSLRSLFQFGHIKQMFKSNFKRRPNYGRVRLLFLIIANIMTIFILYGANTIAYGYTRQKLNWSIQQFSIYSAVSATITILGAVVGVKVGNQMLGIGDLPLAIAALFSSIGEYVILAFATQSWHMYVGSAVALLKASSAPLIKSQLTKLMPKEEVAKTIAFLCVLDAICPFLSPFLYNTIYRYTIDTFPGAFYFLSVGLTSVAIVALSFTLYFSKKGIVTHRLD